MDSIEEIERLEKLRDLAIRNKDMDLAIIISLYIKKRIFEEFQRIVREDKEKREKEMWIKPRY